jgi:hypothetical protein
MATGKSRGAQSMLVLFFTELEASCFDYVLLWTSSCFVSQAVGYYSFFGAKYL